MLATLHRLIQLKSRINKVQQIILIILRNHFRISHLKEINMHNSQHSYQLHNKGNSLRNNNDDHEVLDNQKINQLKERKILLFFLNFILQGIQRSFKIYLLEFKSNMSFMMGKGE